MQVPKCGRLKLKKADFGIKYLNKIFFKPKKRLMVWVVRMFMVNVLTACFVRAIPDQKNARIENFL